jgi:colicin import membrane protein
METETEAITALVHVEQLTPMQLFAPGAMNPILERIKAEVRAIETDISTDAGRKAIKSLAYKIARTKTFIDEQRKSLVGDEKKRLAAIDAEGSRVWDELEALKDEVRKPLTDWEEAEKSRIAENERRIADMKAVSEISHFSLENIATARAYLDERWNHNFQEFSARAIKVREAAELHLAREEAAVKKMEQERTEAAERKRADEEKARVEREAKIAEDARLKAEAEAKRREEARALAAKQREEEHARIAAEDKARLERERKESEARLQKSLDDARAKAQRDKLAAEDRERKAEQDRIAAAKKAEDDRIAAEKKAKDDREAAVVAERKRQEAIRAAEEAQREAIARERVRREADKAHRKQVHDEAVLALLGQVAELTNDSAREVVAVISAALIPHVAITY